MLFRLALTLFINWSLNPKPPKTNNPILLLKMIKMSFFMVLTFIMSWAPMQMVTLYRFYDDTFVSRTYFAWLFFSAHWLAVSRSFINPFIYACNNQRFRKGFAYFLLLHFLRTSPKRYQAEIMSQRLNQSSSLGHVNSSRLHIPLALMSK